MKMLFGLGHDTIISGDHEECNMNSGDACYHIADKFFVSGDIYNCNGLIQVCKPQIDGHSPRFFFSEAIRIRAGEGLDQGRLPVVNMTGCTDNDLHVFLLY